MDIQYLLFLQNLRESLPDFVSKFMMFLSNADLICRYLIPLVLFWCISKEIGAFVSLCNGLGSVFNQLLKNTFCVYRPWIRSDNILPYGNAKTTATGYSFPSGHSVIASTVYGSTAYRYWSKHALSIFLIVVVVLTGFSRNYLGCHTPQDVAVGLTEGVLAIVAICFIERWLSADETRDKWILLGGILFSVAMIVYAEFKSYPMDYINGTLIVDPEKMKYDCYSDGGMFIGILVGWFLERRFVNFDINGKWWEKILRAVVGTAVIILIYCELGKVLSACVASPKFVKFVVQFLTEIFILFLGPLVIKCIQKN